jgi:DNA-binding NarL/FixJ family response regulator
VGEAESLAAARAAGYTADAWMTAPDVSDSTSMPNGRDSPPGLRGPAYGEDEGPFVEALTPRELQVLELLADGLPNKRIAARLGVSPETIKFHVTQISGKLGVSNRTEAVRVAIRRGLLSI